ncbi:MAG: carboxypeptidase regulatory-like domain-containing protein [Gemmatimonadaceae bacterium]|nr:carboxypeptidase regulatory-like domain-containing protein [Gemmatimonadaceae bacterium]
MRLGRSLASVGLLTTLSLAAGCIDPPVTFCNFVGYPAISVSVRDAATGAPIAAGSTLVLVDGSFVDSVTVPEDALDQNSMPLVTPHSIERPGRYQVTVRRAGYQDWRRSDVLVREGDCNVFTLNLTARLKAIR